MSTPIAAIAALIGEPPRHVRALSGGDLSAVWQAEMADGRLLVVKQAANVAAEADMLRAIAASGVRVPQVVATQDDLMILSHVQGGGRLEGAAWDDLADQLGRLHVTADEPYGWAVDHGFGRVAIPNDRSDYWPRFWAEQRLLTHVPHIDAAIGRRLERLSAHIDDVLPARPGAVLLHGDLWGGNVMVGADGRVAALIDPACYYGHREVDWGMLTLFNSPPDRFFAAMEPEHGWQRRLACYRLWPLLVHLRLFGASYRSAVERELATLGV